MSENENERKEHEELFGSVIDAYTTEQAEEDGLIIDLRTQGLVRAEDHLWYVTHTVWDGFVRTLGQGAVVDITYLRRIVDVTEERIRQVLAENPDEWFVPIAGPCVAALGSNGKWVLMHRDDY